MIKLSNGAYVIDFDNGYQFGKTAQSLFDNGVYINKDGGKADCFQRMGFIMDTHII